VGIQFDHIKIDYTIHRNWLRQEFPELFKTDEPEYNNPLSSDHNINIQEGSQLIKPVKKVFEIGCGAGNTYVLTICSTWILTKPVYRVFPIIAQDPNIFVYAGDFSKIAIDVVKSSPLYNEERCKAFVYDITSPNLPDAIEPNSIDICICIFVLSALNPSAWKTAANNILNVLKPGGMVLFRGDNFLFN
jgi:tRNAThr (cytosine32-N3)-methyltransferase